MDSRTSTLLKMISSTLNTIEVKGKDNLDRLLGCINAIDSIVKSAEEPAEETTPDGADDGKE